MRTIAATVLVLCMTSGLRAEADGKGESAPKGRLGSVARQLDLKMQAKRALRGNKLTTVLQHNREAWENLPPDQRDAYRRQAQAFLKDRPQEQDKLLEHYEKLIQLSVEKRAAYRRRAQWLPAVVASFTPAEREALKAVSPEDRARRLLERRDELLRQGKLTLEEPATASSSAPARGQ